MSTIETLNISSYNVKHLNISKSIFLNELFDKCDFLFLQEHCLYQSQLNFIQKIIPNAMFHGISSMDENILNHGRPYGGNMIVWNKNINHKVSVVNTTSKRISSVIIYLNDNVSLLLINVYMPCDDRTRGDRFNELCSILVEISHLCKCANTRYILIGGDFNIDPRRNTHHTTELSHFISREGFLNGLNAPFSNVKYTFSSTGVGDTSLIDHILLTDTLFNSMTQYYTIDGVDNLSDHCALFCSIKLNIDYLVHNDKIYTERLSWCKANNMNIANYQDTLNMHLNNISIPVNAMLCNDLFCKNHTVEINRFYDEIVSSCKSASSICIPHSRPTHAHGKNSKIAGWVDNIEDKRQTSLFWNFLWKENGSPHNGCIAAIARKTRASYHYAIRSTLKRQTKIRSEKMAESVSRNMSRDFWREVKQIKRTTKSVAMSIDGHNDNIEILNIFENKYKHLYNSVPYCANEMEIIKDEVNTLIAKNDDNMPCILANDVANAIKHLKKGKTGLCNMVSSDCFVNGTHKLNTMLAILFNVILKHGSIINEMVLGIMSPIPKGKRCNDTNSDNYRAITTGSVIGKILDWVILLKNNDILASDDLQFGFKPELSTTLCTAMVLETVSHFNNNGSDVYGLFLDASKAFDRINYHMLFRKLIKKKLPGIYIRSLFNMYTNSRLQIKWNNVLSTPFNCTNGVKQGGVLSPILFALYIDDLLIELRENGSGCHINSMFCGAFSYADDIVLLAPTVNSLNSMVNTCQNYSTKYDILFNPTKSQLITFSVKKKSFAPTIIINNSTVPIVQSVKHLGHELSCNILKSDSDRVISDFNMRINMFHLDFGSLQTEIKNRLFKQYCCSYYGTQLYNLCSNDIYNICRAWRVGFRKIWGLPNMTHCNLLYMLGNIINTHDLFIKRFLKFFIKAFNSTNSVVNHLSKMSCLSNSPMGTNFKYVCYRFGYTKSMFNNSNVIMNVFYRNIHTVTKLNDLNRCNMIRELVDMRDGYQAGILSNADIDDMLSYVCTY